MWSFFKSNSVEDQLERLAEIGITLSEGITLDTVLSVCSRDNLEKIPYARLLHCLGEELELGEGNYVPLSPQIWWFDAECIEGPGSYAAIAQRLRGLAIGMLPIENIRDDVDFKEQTAWISFELDGRLYRWPLKVNDDGADPELLVKFAKLLADRGTGARYVILEQGTGSLISCCTPIQLEKLIELTRLPFKWLE